MSGVCNEAQAALTACYAAGDASDFTCVNDHSQPSSVCLPERRALSECLAPGSGACLDQCAREAEACGNNLSDCEAGCAQPAPGCEEASIIYNACLLELPVECRDFFKPDTRPIELIPCGYEGIAAYICAK